MMVDMSIVQTFLGLGAAAVAAACGFVIAMARQISALTENVKTLSNMWAQEREERIASLDRIHERLDNHHTRSRGDARQ